MHPRNESTFPRGVGRVEEKESFETKRKLPSLRVETSQRGLLRGLLILPRFARSPGVTKIQQMEGSRGFSRNERKRSDADLDESNHSSMGNWKKTLRKKVGTRYRAKKGPSEVKVEDRVLESRIRN